MHDVSLGIIIRDYLTGEEIENTTFEDLRQALAKLLVEELGYPRQRLKARVPVTIPVKGEDYTRLADLVAYGDGGEPLLLIMFCAGDVTTYERESLAAARLFAGGPVPLVAVTDTKDAVLLATKGGDRLGQGMRAIPAWKDLTALAAAHPMGPLSEEHAERECRILYAYTETLYKCCSFAACAVEAKGGGFAKK